MKFKVGITRYVDVDTGEQITRTEAQVNYRTIKIKKHVRQLKATESTRIISYIHECRRNESTQQEIEFRTHQKRKNTK